MTLQNAIGLNVATIAGILGLLLLFTWYRTSNSKKDVKKLFGTSGIVLLGVFLLGAFAVPSLTSPLNGVTTGTPSGLSVTTQPSNNACLSVAKTTVTMSTVDKYNSTATGGTHRYRVNGGPWTTVSNAGTFTASPGDKLDVLWYNGATDGWYSRTGSYTVPCAGTFTPTENGDAVKLALNGSVTSTVKNDKGQVTVVGVTNQTLSAGDVKDTEVTLSGQYQRDYPYGFIAVVEYNKTALDAVTLTQNGQELASASLPQSYNTLKASSFSSVKAYAIPALISNDNLIIKATLDADDSFNPGYVTGAGGDGDNVTITYFPLNYFVDDKNGGVAGGPATEDETGTATRIGSHYTSVIYYD